jgi:transposase
VVRIGLESGPLSTWLWHELKAMGLPVVCLDARHAKAVLAVQGNKNDRKDARGIAQLVRAGWFREVKVKSYDNHKIRAALGARAQLVGMRTGAINQARGLLKNVGRVPSKGKLSLNAHMHGDDLLSESLRALSAVIETLEAQILALSRKIEALSNSRKECRVLMTIPGVGPMTAMTFASAVDDVERFRKSRSVGAYFGLTPKSVQSGESDWKGGITRTGDALVRSYLYEAACVLLARVKRWSALKAWGVKLARKAGMKKAAVAVARKLAVMMHRMLCTGEVFRWSEKEAAAA